MSVEGGKSKKIKFFCVVNDDSIHVAVTCMIKQSETIMTVMIHTPCEISKEKKRSLMPMESK